MKTQKKILIIEDDEDLLTLLSNRLKKEGFEVIDARDGVRGLSMARDQNPDLLVLDLDIPGIKGMTVLAKLQENEKTAKLPVIIFSNSAEVTDLGKAIEHGVLHYLTKSDWSLEDVLEKVKEVLD